VKKLILVLTLLCLGFYAQAKNIHPILGSETDPEGSTSTYQLSGYFPPENGIVDFSVMKKFGTPQEDPSHSGYGKILIATTDYSVNCKTKIYRAKRVSLIFPKDEIRILDVLKVSSPIDYNNAPSMMKKAVDIVCGQTK